jgi:hypothetical protein
MSRAADARTQDSILDRNLRRVNPGKDGMQEAVFWGQGSIVKEDYPPRGLKNKLNQLVLVADIGDSDSR